MHQETEFHLLITTTVNHQPFYHIRLTGRRWQSAITREMIGSILAGCDNPTAAMWAVTTALQATRIAVDLLQLKRE